MLSIVLNFAGPWWPHPHTPNHMSLYHPLRRPCLFISLFPRAGFALWRRPDQWLAIVHGKNLISCRCLPWLFRRRTWTSAMISSEFLLFVQLCNSKCEISLPEWQKTNNFLGQNMRKNHHISIHKKTTIETFPTSPKKNCLPVAPPSHLGPLSRRTRSTRGKRNPRPRVGSCAIPRCLLRRGPHAKCVPLQNVCSLEFVVSCEFAIHLYLISIWYNDTCITQPIIIFPEFLLDHSIIISTLYIYYYMYFMRVLHVLSYSHYHGKTTSAWISWAAAQSLT